MRTVCGIVVGVASLFLASGCAVNRYRPAPPAPCDPSVQPIRYQNLVVSLPINFDYTPRDRAGGAVSLRQVVLDQLNQDGKPYGDSFSLQNGSQLNFTLTYNFYDNNEIYTGNVNLAGWGQGNISSRYTQGSYNDPIKMVQDLTDQVFAFIRDGWHDTRPQCAGR